ncbi:LbtU family siderophore porin [Thermodesulfobacteriota bacterium]
MIRITAIILSCCVFTSLCVSTSLALASDIDTRSEIENLKKRINQLDPGDDSDEETAFSLNTNGSTLTFWGAVEVEAGYSKIEGQPESSDIVAATGELGLDITITDSVGGHLIFSYEEDEEPELYVDEANIVLSCPLQYAGGTTRLIAGKMALPFGQFNTSMISDPLTLELGETYASALVFIWANDSLDFSLGFFNGRSDTDGSRDNIDTAVASLSLTPWEGIAFGLSYISDLAESDFELVDTDTDPYPASVCGAAAFLNLEFGSLVIDAEYVTATKDFNQTVIDPAGDLSGEKPQAMNLDIAWNPGDNLGLAVRYELADDILGDISRYGGTVSYGIAEQTVLALEYLLTAPDSGDENEHTITSQLAIEF